jgi:hypothetical protein
MITGCTDCHKEQGTINELLQQAIKDAQTLANTEHKKVAVFVEGRQFSYRIIIDTIPPGTCKVVEPL